MPEVTMCINKKCPLKDKCFRFTATPKPYWQSYADFGYGGLNIDKTDCSMYIDNTIETDTKRKAKRVSKKMPM